MAILFEIFKSLYLVAIEPLGISEIHAEIPDL